MAPHRVLVCPQFTLEASDQQDRTGCDRLDRYRRSRRRQRAVPLITKGRGEGDGTNVDMNYFLGIHGTTGRLVADFEDNDEVNTPTDNNHPVNVNGTTGTVIPSNVWTHVAATYDGSQWRLYVNGNLEVTETETGSTTPRFDSIQRFAIGSALTSAGATSGFFAGQMDEVRVWDVARTQTQIRATINDEVTGAPNLVGRWGLNQGSGTTAANSGTAGSNATLTATPTATWGTGSDFGNRALVLQRFDAVRSNCHDPRRSRLSRLRNSPWSLVQANGAGWGPAPVLGLVRRHCRSLDHEGSCRGRGTRRPTSTTSSASTPEPTSRGGLRGGAVVQVVRAPRTMRSRERHVVNGTWHHAAATYDGADWRLYLDGEPRLRRSGPAASSYATVVSPSATAHQALPQPVGSSPARSMRSASGT